MESQPPKSDLIPTAEVAGHASPGNPSREVPVRAPAVTAGPGAVVENRDLLEECPGEDVL